MTVLPPPPPPTSDKQSGATATFPAPTGAQIMRALRAPAIGYAWLLAGAVAVMVLIVVAANIGTTSDDTGVDSNDTNAVGVLLGMPFQIAGMALLGSLRFSEDGVRASLFLPPAALTALYLVTTTRAARKGDMVPEAGTRALLGVIVGFTVAVIITPVTWALAMRADGAALHTASVNLFFGLWVLTGVASFIGTSRAAGAMRPAWIPNDYAAAARVWLGSVALWVIAATIVLTVVAVADDGLWVGVLVPIWGPTVGLYSYAVSHFGSLQLADEGVYISDFNAAWIILGVVGALALALVSSLAWHLRRDTRDAALKQPGSWVVLPATYAAGGILVWLVPSVALGGGYGAYGGSVVLQPAFWLLFVLALWGGAIELASRFVAPSLAPALPARFRAALSGPDRTVRSPQTHVPAAAPAAARPLTPEERARYKRLGIIVGIVAALALAGGITVSAVNSQLYGPEDQAKAYLDAVVDGDLAQVNDLAPVDTDQADTALLTGEVYNAADNRITGYELGPVDKDGDTATVKVRLKGLAKSETVELTLTKDGHRAGVFDNWQVTDGGLAKPVSLEMPYSLSDDSDAQTADDSSFTVNGIALDEPDTDVWLLPGDYVFDAFAGNKWLESQGDPVTVSAKDSYQFAEIPEATASDAFNDEVQNQINDYLATCMASTELEPDGCPNQAYAYGDVRNVVWTMDQAPTADLEYFDGTFPADLSYGESGHATVTYEEEESYGYGKPDWQPQTESSDLYLNSITVSEDGDTLVVNVDG